MATKKCPFCAEEVLVDARICKHCKSDMSAVPAKSSTPKEQIVRPLFRAVGGIIAILIVVAVIAAALDSNNSGVRVAQSNTADAASPAPEADATVEPYRTTARQLQADYDENEVAENQKISGRPVEVIGIIASIDEDFTNTPVIQLAGKNEFENARLTLKGANRTEVAALKKGQQIAILCQKMMRVVSSPAGTDCQIE